MAIAIIVQAIGFSASERNAFSTVLDLSPSRLCTYRLWQPTMTREADIYVLDGESSVNWQEVSQLSKTTTKPFLWVGHNPPRSAAHSFLRPVRWMSVMDALEVVASSIDLGALPGGQGMGVEVTEGDVDLDLNFDELDIDLDLSGPADVAPAGLTLATATSGGLPSLELGGESFATSTASLPADGAGPVPKAPPLRTLMTSMLAAPGAATAVAASRDNPDTGFDQTLAGAGGRRALVLNPSLYEGLFLRQRLMMKNIASVDEAASPKEAMACAQARAYDVAIIDIDAPGGDGWALAEELRHAQNPVGQVIMLSAKASALKMAKARMAGMALVGAKPIDTAQLDRLLTKAAA